MASAAAALIARARRDIQHEFFCQDAVRADRAIAFDPKPPFKRRVFERWRRAGVIRQEAPGLFWLDVTAYDADLRRRHNRLRIALLVIVGLLLVGGISGIITVNLNSASTQSRH
jgi:hypothetical protein